MLVQDFLHASVARRPGKVALVCGAHRYTYAQIEDMANRLAHALCQGGVQRGDRVGVCLPNDWGAVISIFAILKAGAVFVPINPGVKPDKLQYILNNCRAAAVILDDRPSSWRCVLRYRDFPDIEREFPPERPPAVNIDLDLACLIYTSGSTGEPKGVMCDHSNVTFAASSIIQYLGNTENDIIINTLPLSFDYGLYQLLMTFKFGGTLVLENSFAFPSTVLKRMEHEGVTGFPGVPTTFGLMLQTDLPSYDLSNLRYLTNTGAALPPTHIERLRRAFPQASLYSMYGLTETKRTLYLPPDQLHKHSGSVGIAIPGTEVWIEDENGHRLGPDQVGELVVRGRHVMRGYWEAPEETAKCFRLGPIPGERLCYSGDLFRMDADGYMYFVGRKDDIIKCRGEKVAPKEVENVLYRLPGVLEAAVVGTPDPICGHAIKAIIVPKNRELTRQMVLAHCAAHLENFMVPKYIEFRPELPKTFSGKINKTELTQQCAALSAS